MAYLQQKRGQAPASPSVPGSPLRHTTSVSTNHLHHKRGLSEATGSPKAKGFWEAKEANVAPVTPEQFRTALRPLQQAPGTLPAQPSPHSLSHTQSHSRSKSLHDSRMDPFHNSTPTSESASPMPTSPPLKSRPHSLAISRSDSVRAPTHDRGNRNSAHVHFASPSHIEKSELQGLQRSATKHLRTLSKFAQNADDDDFSIKSPEQEVVGLHGRRRLQRTMTTKDKKGSESSSKFASSWEASKWMDRQRQFLQAYEYLCHIGEAKEWIEDIIHKQIPEIVQMEEALRDGVTLAEVVQAIHPDRPIRIFKHERLQFRHSDNIALFFRFLAEMELPELFRFELVDLYEKKNIPKVIYCIHALSWLLFRKGVVDFRIGNLVGQLQFEDHELEAMQKGLDKAGISMPNFSGMGANFGEPEPEPEPEPVETEEDRIQRELSEHEDMVEDLQSQIRGAMVRLQLGDTMNQLWDAEEALVDLQSRIRGDFARQISDYRMDMKRFAVQLQSAARGFLIRKCRSNREQTWKSQEKQVTTIQSLFRARKARTEVKKIRSHMQKQDMGIRNLQAAIRGALGRWNVSDQYEATREAEEPVRWLQAAIRGAIKRKQVERQIEEGHASEEQVISLQAAIRGALQRNQVERQLEDSKASEQDVVAMQAAIRGMLERKGHAANADLLRKHSRSVATLQHAMAGFIQRRKLEHTRVSLDKETPAWLELQSAARGQKARRAFGQLKSDLQKQSASITALQSAYRAGCSRKDVNAIRDALSYRENSILAFQSSARGHMFRSKHHADIAALHALKPAIKELQSLSRAYLERQKVFDVLCQLNEEEEQIVELQSLARALLGRRDIGVLLGELEEDEDAVMDLQSAIRGSLVRKDFAEKQRFYKENMEKVIKVQSFIRARQQGQAYKSLTSGKNPPVGTVKNFVHLLNDSDFDFDEELEFERLRKTVVQRVRQNEMAEQYIDQLDIKIALLVKNKITLDEVVKHQRHFGGHVGSLLNNTEISSKDPFDLKALNKNSRRKLEHYQELFFLLQTQPQYLARLFHKLKEQGMPEQEGKRVELLMMGLFGFAQKRREEYYLLKLVTRSIQEEAEHSGSLQEYLRGTFFWSRLLAAYVRSPRDRKYMRDLFGPLVRESIFENPDLDLESDPMQIYRASINNEELSTGQRSRRNPDISREEAIRDPETRELFISHLQDLRDICDHFFVLLEETLPRMPYGLRFIAQQTFNTLVATFPGESQQHLLQVVGHWLWKAYLIPALTQPEMWGVIDRGLSPLHKRNLGEVGKVLGQVFAGRLFGGDHIYLQPLNTWVGEAIERMEELLTSLIDIRDPEQQFDIDEFNDLFARVKPTLYIKMADIFAIHHLVTNELSHLSDADDVLREIIRELGSAQSNENEMMSVGSNEISLQLTPKFHDKQDPEADLKQLFMETKRLVLFIIRIQAGANLLDILVRPITPEDDDKWFSLLDEEAMHQKRNPRAPSAYSGMMEDEPTSTLLDITSMSYAEVKSAALENILLLEQHGKVNRHNQYQDLLNAIAIDIRTKHRRRVQRTRELEGVRATLTQLDSKASYLDEQLQSYNDYIEQAMITLQNKKGKKRFLLPFTKQYNHERELARSGRTPKFGSYKYSARSLAEKGVLVSWDGYDATQWNRINVTLSSDEVGVFHIEGSMGSLMIPGASASVPLDDLLQAQFDNHQFMNLFRGTGGEGGLKLNVNLFLHLVFKKFYREE
ncbi:putative ras GTPase activating protein [Aureobasidium pullulans]|uniref:Ras GTPase activating protein n=1 Tax=Aureobasidium pullulans TaxID=5580 RepID=A0AB74IWP5_AURPU|nr:putative ras GTPase activating protein [Aureobasidium pullulans]TIA61939.1 putative ras GTPase activating protein [Aureobasidium pullulans]